MTEGTFRANQTHTHTHLETNTASIKAALVHGGILSKKELAETVLILEEEVAVTVVMKQPLGEVEQSPQLAQSTAVRFHFCSMMGCTEKDAPPVGCDVVRLVDDVQKTATHHLKKKIRRILFIFSNTYILVRIAFGRNTPTSLVTEAKSIPTACLLTTSFII